MASERNTPALLALIFGIASFIPFIGSACAIAAVVLGIIGIKKSKTLGTGKGMAIAGLIIGGIVIVVQIVLAIGALLYFGVGDPGNMLPESTSFAAPVPHADSARITASSNSIEIPFLNNQGFPITLSLAGGVTPDASTTCDNPVLSATYNGVPIIAGETQIPNGDSFVIIWDCDDADISRGSRFKGTLNFEYTNTQTFQTRNHIGTVQGRYS